MACSYIYHDVRLDRVVISMMPESGCTSEAFAILYADHGLRSATSIKQFRIVAIPASRIISGIQYQCILSSWQVTTGLAV
jgi:hypothetical protein